MYFYVKTDLGLDSSFRLVFRMVSPTPVSLECLLYVTGTIHNNIYSFILSLDTFKDLSKYFNISN